MKQFNLAPMTLRRNYGFEGQDVFDFHEKFLVPMAPKPSLLDKTTADFRIKFLREELNEFIEAHEQGDLLKAADALVDLVYVAMGTALMMGLPWLNLWRRVQERNMAKERAKDDGSNSTRGSPLDVIKPAGWYPPDHTPDLGASKWPIFDATYVSQQVASYLQQEAKQAGQPNIRPVQQGYARAEEVRVARDGTKHHTSVAEPVDFRTKTGDA